VTTPTTTDTNTNKINPSSATDLTSPGPVVGVRNDGQHLRRCAQCCDIGCCDSSPSQHASRHAAITAHLVIQSFEPGESWFRNYLTEEFLDAGPELAEPRSPPSTSRHRDHAVEYRMTGRRTCTDTRDLPWRDRGPPARRTCSNPHQAGWPPAAAGPGVDRRS